MNTAFSIFANKNFYWRIMMAICVMFAVISASDVAVANGGQQQQQQQGNDIIGETLCRLVNNLSGGIAKSIATIAIFAVGVGLFMGKLNWGVAAATAAGVGIIFGAGQLVAWLSGDANNATCE
ncbi:MAG: hypothetical protein RLZZ59_908 [Pseudomonadota bacterium]|jgi:type IV secretory pathway VirB2 component (pilin)